MAHPNDQVHGTISRVAIVISTVVAICLPMAYFGLAYQYQVGSMQSAAGFKATLTTQYIALNPEMWQFQVLRLNTVLDAQGEPGTAPEQRQILDQNFQIIGTNNTDLASPTMSARAPLFDAGKTVGYFEVRRSVRPLLVKTGFVGLIAFAFAGSVFAVLKLLPMRALNRALSKLRQSEELFSKAFHVSPDPVIIYRVHDGKIINVNKSFSRLTGVLADDVIGQSISELNLWAADTAAEADRRNVVLAQVVQNCELGLRTKSGERREMLLSSELTEIDKHPCLLIVARDITEQKRTEQRLAYLANYDHLTGLPNRILFRDRLTGAMHRAQRGDRLVGLLYLDLDRFKQVNDSLGHQFGDQLLRQVTARLQQSMRTCDLISTTSLDTPMDAGVARLGGDEFTIMLEDIKHTDEIARVAQRILAALSVPYDLQGHTVFVGASIGITVYPTDDTDLDNLIRNADIAMYRAKALGRNNFQFYTGDLNANAEERLLLEIELRQALERNQFELYYQAKQEIGRRRIAGVEALLRWNSPRQGLVGPDVFIPFLEDSGLIVPVGAWVLKTACRQAAAWAERGLILNMAVNLSARQFRDEDLTQTIQAALQETGLPAQQLEVEVTESMLMENRASSQNTLTAIKQMGIRISIDDFGTGYSSLAYLKHFPLDTLKIDRSFVRDLGVDAGDTTIVYAIIALAHSLRLNVVAEGVETEAQLEFLHEAQCEQAQGYFIHRPASAAAFERWLAQTQDAQKIA